MLISHPFDKVTGLQNFWHDFPPLRDYYPFTSPSSTSVSWYFLPQPQLTFTEVNGVYQGYLDMPGYDKSTIKLEVEDGVLTVTGKRQRDSNELQVTTTLPKDYGHVSAKFDNGELLVTVEKVNKKVLILPQ